jgi:hypothetical protein
VGRSENARRIITNFQPSNLPTFQFVFVLTILFLSFIACGPVNPQFLRNNEVRQAVFAYERAKRGPVKDLVIHFRRDEPRIRFDGQNQNGGHTVWLYPAGGQEYFATRPQTASYLYIQEIEFSEDQKIATVNVYRGDGSGYQGWQLTVTRQGNSQWLVTDEVELEAEPVK